MTTITTPAPATDVVADYVTSTDGTVRVSTDGPIRQAVWIKSKRVAGTVVVTDACVMVQPNRAGAQHVTVESVLAAVDHLAKVGKANNSRKSGNGTRATSVETATKRLTAIGRRIAGARKNATVLNAEIKREAGKAGKAIATAKASKDKLDGGHTTLRADKSEYDGLLRNHRVTVSASGFNTRDRLESRAARIEIAALREALAIVKATDGLTREAAREALAEGYAKVRM